MSRPARFEEHRYLGDKRTLRLHDLDAPDVDALVADVISSEQFATFAPDTLAEARNRGYRPYRPRRRLRPAARS